MNGPFRLKLRVGEEGPEAHLYREGASQFDGPVARFRIDTSQEVPRLAAGAVVDVQGDSRRGIDVVRCPDGVMVRPVGAVLGAETFPLFAEPGIVHPAVSGWAGVEVPTSVEAWTARLEGEARRARRSLVGGVVLGAACLASLAVAVFAPKLFGLSVVTAAGAVRGLRGTRRAQEVLAAAAAVRAADGRPMVMRLWWAVGGGTPLPVASLSAPGEERVVEVILAAVPQGFDPPRGTAVSVHGDPAVGGTAVIRCGDVELWPASAVLAVLP